MNQIYKKNVKLLLDRTNSCEAKIKFLNRLHQNNDEDVLRRGARGLEVLHDGIYYQTVSRCPEKELELLTKGLEEKKDFLLIIIGLENTELLHKVMDMITADSRLLIYEPDPQVLKYRLEHTDLSFLLKTNQVGILFDYDSERELDQEIFAYSGIWKNLIKNLHVIAPPYAYHARERYQYVIRQLIAKLQLQVQVLGNSLEDIFNGQENNYKNVDAILESNRLEEIKDRFKGYPGIVVASGPSLDKNIEFLSGAQDRALIIACDASMNACKAHGVRPDAIASIERDEPTYSYYYKDKQFDEDLVLVGPSLLWPKIFQEFKGKKIVTNKVNTGIESWWAGNFEGFEFLNQGMSSANVAFAYARYAGCDPIILVGQDLAYTDNKKHSDLTHTEFEGENDASEGDGEMTEDIYGQMVPTDAFYNAFRQWFELQISTHKELTVIDATEGGAKIHGSRIMTLREAIEQYCTDPLPMHLYDCLEDKSRLSSQTYIKKYEELIQAAKKQQRRMKSLRSRAAKHYRLLEELYDVDGLKKMSKEQLVEVLLKIQKGDKIVQTIDEHVITYFQQMVRQTIIFVKALGNEITPENVIQNIRFQANLMGVIKNSAALILGEYDKMIAFLEEKKAEKEGEETVCEKRC